MRTDGALPRLKPNRMTQSPNPYMNLQIAAASRD
jgi:hypothetical protein